MALEAARENDWEKPGTRRRNAIATRKAETRVARVEKELQGAPRHCFGGGKFLRQGKLGEWRRRRAGNALFAGETGRAFGNEVGDGVRIRVPFERCQVPLSRLATGGANFPTRIQSPDATSTIYARHRSRLGPQLIPGHHRGYPPLLVGRLVGAKHRFDAESPPRTAPAVAALRHRQGQALHPPDAPQQR